MVWFCLRGFSGWSVYCLIGFVSFLKLLLSVLLGGGVLLWFSFQI